MPTWVNHLHMEWIQNWRCLHIPRYLNCPFSFGPLLPLVLANWRAIVAYLMYAVSSSCISYCESKSGYGRSQYLLPCCALLCYIPYLRMVFQIHIKSACLLTYRWIGNLLLFQGMHIYSGLCNHICSSSEDWSFLYSGKSNINEAIAVAEQHDVDSNSQFLDSLKKG